MNNIKYQNLDIFSYKIRIKYQFLLFNKPNIIKNSKYQ